MRPAENEFAPFYQKYVALVPESDVIPALEAQADVLEKLHSNAAAKETFAYEPGKWTVRQVVGHVCDVERVFGFRAFTFSRQDPNALPGFDQDTYVNESRYLDVALADLVEDFALIRRSNVRVLGRLRDEQWLMSGTANGKVITVRALAFVMVGHVRHHLQILRDRYGVTV